MTVLDIFLIGVGLAMDAFAVSICKGLAAPGSQGKTALVCGLWFGGFQALMPLLGYLLGTTVSGYISRYAGLVAFVLLCFVGSGMIREALKGGEECDASGADISPRAMLPLAVATSIDALAIGVSFAGYRMNILLSIAIIGVTTFVISAAGVRIGSVFGTRYQKRAELAGGIILVLIGLKLLLGI